MCFTVFASQLTGVTATEAATFRLTFAAALLPTYPSIDIWGAVIFTVLRFVQGVGVGGKGGGPVLMSMEWSRDDKTRGRIARAPRNCCHRRRS
jgi:MFS family permease